jgi:cytochrome o ubiquinol oxidase subunit 2
LVGGLIVLALIGLAIWQVSHSNVAVLNPKGSIGGRERSLMITATILMLIVVVPVYVLTFLIATRYHEDKKAKYTPDWDGDRRLEFTWWAVPSAIIFILSIITWRSAHQLDPSIPISSKKQAINIQVVALQWKWLFIYPAQQIATVNYFELPQNTPVNFQITADAPMNSFWIPQLGGQIYAMPGMSTQLHLIADQTGSYEGSSANISGEGFSGMTFKAIAVNDNEFNNWVKSVKQADTSLTESAYDKLAKPSQDVPRINYASYQQGLYGNIIMKYMSPDGMGH